tara:strand:- start:439 stop:552 length:114 start_codon:yes stop_codon:yes gene_type:complete
VLKSQVENLKNVGQKRKIKKKHSIDVGSHLENYINHV